MSPSQQSLDFKICPRTSAGSSPLSSRPRQPSSSTHSDLNRRRSSGPTSATILSSPLATPLVGSYENSLLCGRMSQSPSKPLPFLCEIGVLGHGNIRSQSLRCPPHVKLGFDAYFYDNIDTKAGGSGAPGSPYVGTIDLEKHYMDLMLEEESARRTEYDDGRTLLARTPPRISTNGKYSELYESRHAVSRFPGYQIPPKGQLQIIIKNPNHTAVKLFLVPYDLSDMPPGTKKVMRQKSYLVSPSIQPSLPSPSSRQVPDRKGSVSEKKHETLKFAVQLQFCSPPLPERVSSKVKAATKELCSSPQSPFNLERHTNMGNDMSQSDLHPCHYVSKNAVTHPHVLFINSPHSLTALSDVKKSSHVKAPKPNAKKTSNAPTIYLHKSIRVIFNMTALDSTDKVRTTIDQADQYVPYAGPSDAWLRAKKARARREAGLSGCSTSSTHHSESLNQSPDSFATDQFSSTSNSKSSYQRTSATEQVSDEQDENVPLITRLCFERIPIVSSDITKPHQNRSHPIKSGLSTSRPNSLLSLSPSASQVGGTVSHLGVQKCNSNSLPPPSKISYLSSPLNKV
ncbi:hypothetical protein CROQUDRAFT_91826 [Cronartium quercuum f. sp. fusiforme G11]|uniref:Atos-like conserved domain-containing protein n=1 Tax=Cronartium quercuum f. sp. fusiforme G11 TaxID=708437 RepID=A0A9P6NJM3_9BASI|nr:hypothetical protein CROQUDRAFT_91826 [Cronartium quercuum f. sp. fusiforme G11]